MKPAAYYVLSFLHSTLYGGNLEGPFLMTIESEADNLPPLGANSWIAIFSLIQPNIYFL